MEIIRGALADASVLLDLDAQDLGDVFHATTEHLASRGIIDEADRASVEQSLVSREKQSSTAIGHALAVPHVYMSAFSEPTVVFARLAHPLNLGAPDGIPTRFLFLLMGPESAISQHLDTLANIAKLMADEEFRYDARIAKSSDDLVAALDRFAERNALAVATPQPAPVDGLQYTGRFAGGVIGDTARRAPHYVSDWLDGLHAKCVGSTFFLFFACLAPAVTFGGLMSVSTGQQIGAVEMLVATAICGIVYALVAGQPLVILGGTGPLLVFTAVLYQVCQDFQHPFLPVYAWVGIWSAVWVVLFALFDASCLMRFFTRFTDETFAALISLIFIYEALKSLVHEFQDLETAQHHSTALLTLLLALGTYYVATSLSRFRHSDFLRGWMREFLADFGPTIAMVSMAAVAFWFHEVDLKPLDVPDKLGSTSGRDWLVPIGQVPTWMKFAAAGPALLVAVLVYLDQNITARLINSPDHHLHKGVAYHLDLLVVGVLIGFCSLFGLPWLVAATVRSLNHVRSLATSEEVVSRSGHTKEKIIHVRENRVTPFAIHLLIGLSLLLLAALKYIPLAVLYGLFLFMGVVSIAGNQFFERMSLWVKDPQLYPATHYIRKVPIHVTHVFTALQFVCLAVLWMVKTSSISWIALLFPLFIAILVPVRLLAGRYFAAEHLAVLDADEDPEQEDTEYTG